MGLDRWILAALASALALFVAGGAAQALAGGQGPPDGGPSGGGSSGGGGGSGGDGSFSSCASGGASNVLADVASSESTDMVEAVILLDVGGMKCGGCVGHVKKILEGQASVSVASVNLATETAMVRVMVLKALSSEDSAARLLGIGEQLAQALTRASFPSTPRDPTSSNASLGSLLSAKRAHRLARLQQVTRNLIVAWGLSALCGLGHLAHAWPAAPPWMHFLSSTPLNAAISAAALLGPGREILVSGFQALAANRPDMNSLVGLGATASFGVSCVAALMPHLRWKTFFEEPAMLLGFVLIGRALEERAKLRASADMTALQELVPTRARLLLQGGGYADVPAESVAAGDLLTVLPGDRMPVDGTVVAGRSSVDESALTGEPMPITKILGDKVTAGTINCDGALSVQAEHSGQQTVIADIVRMVEAAQARTAPIQRLADSVAGKFAYGVMALSAATFAFWALAGAAAFPQVLAGATAAGTGGKAATLLLSLQMACNVGAHGTGAPLTITADPGGDVLEATSQVDVVVFDKTGTLTAGKPQVTAVHALLPAAFSEAQLLHLAAALERNTSHPVAKAIVRAADSEPNPSGHTSTVASGSFSQEPGSGVVAVVNGTQVCVGTIEWLQRQGTTLTAREQQLLHTGLAFSSRQASPTDASHRSGTGSSSQRGTGRSTSLPEPASEASSPHATSQAATSQHPNSGSGGGSGGSSTLPQTPGHSDSSGLGAGFSETSSSSSGSSSSSNVGAEGRGTGALGSSNSRVFVSVGGVLAGCIEVADAVRHDAARTVAELQSQGVRCIMLSGDIQDAANEVASSVGIRREDVFAGVKPAGKAALVEKLKAAGSRVAMVGDGVNDTAALAAAHVGIAMGGGVDAASEVANIVLMGDQLHQVSDAIDLSKRTIRKIQQNLCWAFGYNIIAIPLAAGALLPSLGICLTPSISGALMGFSSLMVVSNSLLLQLEVQHHWNSMAALDPAPLAQAAAYASGPRAVPAVHDTQRLGSEDAAGRITDTVSDRSQSQDKGQEPGLNLRKGARQAHTTSNPTPPTTASPTERVRVERVPPSLQERKSCGPARAPPTPWTASRKPSHQLTNNKEPPSDTVYLQRAVRWGVSTPQQITGRISAAASLDELAACVTRHEHIMNLFSTTAAITRLARLREEHQSQHGQTRRPPRHTPFPSPFPAASVGGSSSVPVSDPPLTSSRDGDAAAATPSPDIRAELQQRFDDDLMKLARRLVDLLRFNLGQDSAAVAGTASLQSSQLPLLSQCLWAMSRLSELYPELKKLAAPIVHLLHKPAFFHSFEDHPPEVLSKTVWAIVKLQLQGHHLEAGAVRDILAQIATAATTRVNDTNEFGCTLLVRGLAKQKLRHASLFKAVAHRGADISTTFTPTHISKTLWAYAALYPPTPSLPPLLHDALAPVDLLVEFESSAGAKPDPTRGSAAGSRSSSGTGRRMFDGDIGTEGSGGDSSRGSKGRGSDEKDSGRGGAGAGRGGGGHGRLEDARAVHLVEAFERLYQSLAETAAVQLPIFKPVDLATLLWACAKLGVVHPRLWEKAGDAVLLSLYRFDEQALVDIAWAYSRIGRREEKVLKPLADQALRRAYKMSAMEVSKLASSFSILQLFPPALFSAIRHEAGNKLHLMTITDLQYLLPAMRQDPGCDATLLHRLTSQLAVMRQARDGSAEAASKAA
ncbi:MAG: hypothetical protein WDW38_001761 [Sanguina aurantia]